MGSMRLLLPIYEFKRHAGRRKVIGVTQARVSRIEKGQSARSEVDTLAAYVQALGGRLRIIADFGDELYEPSRAELSRAEP
jgi:transcriptional regulator with XRE-family HTH domain